MSRFSCSAFLLSILAKLSKIPWKSLRKVCFSKTPIIIVNLVQSFLGGKKPYNGLLSNPVTRNLVQFSIVDIPVGKV